MESYSQSELCDILSIIILYKDLTKWRLKTNYIWIWPWQGRLELCGTEWAKKRKNSTVGPQSTRIMVNFGIQKFEKKNSGSVNFRLTAEHLIARFLALVTTMVTKVDHGN